MVATETKRLCISCVKCRDAYPKVVVETVDLGGSVLHLRRPASLCGINQYARWHTACGKDLPK